MLNYQRVTMSIGMKSQMIVTAGSTRLWQSILTSFFGCGFLMVNSPFLRVETKAALSDGWLQSIPIMLVSLDQRPRENNTCLGLSVNMMRPNPVISSSPFSPWKLQCYGHTAVSDTRKYHIKLVIYISIYIYIYISQLYPIYSNLIIPLYGSRHLFPTCISHHPAVWRRDHRASTRW